MAIHKKLYDDMVDAAMGAPIDLDGPWTVEKYAMSHLRGGQRSVNYGMMARATAMVVAPAKLVGNLTAVESWAHADLFERKEGHRQGEIGGEYERWNGLATLIGLAHQPSLHIDSVANIMRRQLLLWACGCHRMIQKNRRGAPIYRGFGFRSAGLRKLPWDWEGNESDYLYTKALDLPMAKAPTRRSEYHDVVDEYVLLAMPRLGSFGPWLRQFALSPVGAIESDAFTLGVQSTLIHTLRTLTAQNRYTVLRGEGDLRASFVEGPIRSMQTACTRAIVVRSADPDEDAVCYPYRTDGVKKWGRNRKKWKRVGTGGSDWEPNDGAGERFVAWNEAEHAERQEAGVFVPPGASKVMELTIPVPGDGRSARLVVDGRVFE